MYEDTDETCKWECQANVTYMKDDKNCQSILCSDKICQSTKSAKSTLCSDKNFQDTKYIHMWPVKPAIQSHNMLSVERQNHNLVTRKRSKWNNNLCVMTRNVNLPSVFIYGQQWNQVICSQWPSQVICSYPNQHWNNLLTRMLIKMTRTVNLPRYIVMKSVQ